MAWHSTSSRWSSSSQLLRDLLPPPAFALINERVHELVSQPNDTLSISLLVSLVLAFWSASAGTKSVLSALNVAYDTVERRGILGFQLIALAMTLCAVAAAVLAIAVLVFLPTVICVRRPFRLQRRADQRLQHGAAGRAGGRRHRAALPLRAVTPSRRRTSGSFPAQSWRRCCG